MIVFEWDEAKDRLNRAKHGVSFEEASRIFEDPSALMLHDRIVGDEERWQAIGRGGGSAILVVAHVVRVRLGEEVIRIISARRALSQERVRYEAQAI